MTLQHPNGLSYELETSADTDALGQMVFTSNWAKAVPDCPACGWPLTSGDHTRETRLNVFPHSGISVVICDECGWEKEVR